MSNNPAPAPMPEEVEAMCARLLSACKGHPNALIPWPHRLLHDAVDHISDLTRRLAEAEAENGRFAEMLESSVSDWRKLYTEERAERVRIQGILLNDVQAERQESDEHINGLNVVIKTQDKTIRDLKSRVELAADWQVQFAKAEARVRELEAESMTFRTECINLETQRADLEAFKSRVMAWARGRCECCGHSNAAGQGIPHVSKTCRECCNSDGTPNWTPLKEWEVRP